MVEPTECERLAAVQEKSQLIGEFLEWLQGERRLCICRQATKEEVEEYENDRDMLSFEIIHIEDHTGTENLLAEYFHIDLKAVESEKQAILKKLRESAPRE